MNAISRVISIFLVTALAACASTNLPPIGFEIPFQPEEDEKQQWQDSERLERDIEKRELLYKDAGLEEYLNGVADKLVDQSIRDAGVRPRIKMILNPYLNAVALPNGTIYIHTGMLARMENEAQLTTVIGHEMTHFTHRHAVKEKRVVRNRAAYANVLQVLLAGAVGAAGMGDLSGRPAELWALASVRGYSRELEAEADAEGIKVMVRRGYDPREAPKVFQHLQEELDGRAVKEPFAFGTHPLLQERIDNYNKLIGTDYAAQTQAPGLLKGQEEFLERTEQLLLDNAVLDLRIGRAGTARAAIVKHLARSPGSARAYFLLGEVNRRGPDAPGAIAAYRKAVSLDPAYAEAYRELGLIFRAEGRVQDARNAFTRYLALSPGAQDAPIIQGYLAEPGAP